MKAYGMLGPADVAKACGVTTAGVRKWIREGKLKAFTTPGGQYRLDAREVIAFLNKYGIPIPEYLARAAMRRRVLVVDDEPDIVDLVKETLAPHRVLEIDSADNGYDACIIAGETQPDLVILDIFMPKMDGFDVCTRLKENERTTGAKILIITAYGDDENIRRIRQCGADAILLKPFEPEQLEEQVLELLELELALL